MVAHKRVLHHLKSWPENFLNLNDSVQIRRNDRQFSVGDYVKLIETTKDGKPTGPCQLGVIKCVIGNAEGLKEGFVALRIDLRSLVVHNGVRHLTKLK